MILLTFPSIAKGETAIRAQDASAGLDVTVGYCTRTDYGAWTAVLYSMADHPGTKCAEIERWRLGDLRDAACGRLECSGPWWRS